MIFGMAIATREENTPLVRIDFDKGTAHRYQRRRPGGAVALVGIGHVTDNGASWGSDEGLAIIEKFRTTGEA